VAALLGRLGFGWVRFEPPAHVYDMYLLASRREHAAHSDAEIGALAGKGVIAANDGPSPAPRWRPTVIPPRRVQSFSVRAMSCLK